MHWVDFYSNFLEGLLEKMGGYWKIREQNQFAALSFTLYDKIFIPAIPQKHFKTLPL